MCIRDRIRIKYFTDKIEKLRYIDGKSDWIDLRAAEDVTLKAGEFKLIPLGIAMELPKGCLLYTSNARTYYIGREAD